MNLFSTSRPIFWIKTMTTTTTGGLKDIFKAGNLCRSRHSLRRRLYLLVTFINNLSIFKGKNDAPRRVISLTRLKARNWFSSGANPTRRDRVHADEKEGWLLTPVHRRLLNRSDIASGMRRPTRFSLCYICFMESFLYLVMRYFDNRIQKVEIVSYNVRQTFVCTYL